MDKKYLGQYLAKIYSQIDDSELAKFTEYMTNVYMYNVTDGKHNRGLFTIKTYELLAPNGPERDEAVLLGHLLEMFQSFACILDDIIDESSTRRGKTCWYKKVGLIAINDALLLQQHSYQLMTIYLSRKPYYVSILEAFNKMSMLTVYGEMMDTKTTLQEYKLEEYTKSKLASDYKFKTSYYSFVFPVKLALILHYHDKIENYQAIEDILLKIGHLFQMTDDYLDCFGDPDHIGKVGTDIENGKLCWPIVTALELCTAGQFLTLLQNYGQNEHACVQRVKSVYRELDLVNVFDEEIEQRKDEIELDIENYIGDPDQAKVLRYVLAKIYKRDK